jgi:hypothetical protein
MSNFLLAMLAVGVKIKTTLRKRQTIFLFIVSKEALIKLAMVLVMSKHSESRPKQIIVDFYVKTQRS